MRLVAVLRYGNRHGPHPRRSYIRPVRSAGHATDGTDELPGTFAPQCRLAAQLSTQAKGRIERAFQTAQDRLVKGLRQVKAKDLETANAYLGQVFLALWNRRFRREPQLAGDAHRALLPGTNLDSVLSIRASRTVNPDYTVRWDGASYRVEREQITRGMRGARVQLERRLDGSRWLRWRNRILALERCEPRPELMVERRVKIRATTMRSAEEKARARQRLLDARRRLSETYAQLPNRPIWQAMKDSSLRAAELR
jgi:hypothetical protein